MPVPKVKCNNMCDCPIDLTLLEEIELYTKSIREDTRFETRPGATDLSMDAHGFCIYRDLSEEYHFYHYFDCCEGWIIEGVSLLDPDSPESRELYDHIGIRLVKRATIDEIVRDMCQTEYHQPMRPPNHPKVCYDGPVKSDPAFYDADRRIFSKVMRELKTKTKRIATPLDKVQNLCVSWNNVYYNPQSARFRVWTIRRRKDKSCWEIFGYRGMTICVDKKHMIEPKVVKIGGHVEPHNENGDERPILRESDIVLPHLSIDMYLIMRAQNDDGGHHISPALLFGFCSRTVRSGITRSDWYRELYDEERVKNAELRDQILELELRPPPEGGALYRSALNHFVEKAS